jgi:hypothetical protein
MTGEMDATLILRKRDEQTARLLRDCLAVGTPERRVPARARLDRAIGRDLAQLLVTSLTRGSR